MERVSKAFETPCLGKKNSTDSLNTAQFYVFKFFVDKANHTEIFLCQILMYSESSEVGVV